VKRPEVSITEWRFGPIDGLHLTKLVCIAFIMANQPGGKSFQNFLIAWAAVASVAAMMLGALAVFLFLRLQKAESGPRPVAVSANNFGRTNTAMTPLAASRPDVTAHSDDPEKPKTAFSALPRGTQTFDGVTFQIPRAVNIIGARAARAHGAEFARISNQPVTGRGRFIHVLHTGDHGVSPNGNFIWRLVLHYADGQTKRFDFAYGVHLRNYWSRLNQWYEGLFDPDSSITWTGTSIESDRKGAQLRVSRSTLLNPKPDVEVTSADYVSLLGESSAYVFAVTLADGGPTLASRVTVQEAAVAGDIPPAPGIALLPFFLQKGGGEADPTASLDCVFEGDGFTVRFLQAPADPAGRVTVDVPTELVSIIRYAARNSAGLVRAGSIEVAPGSNLAQQTIRFGVE